MHPRHLGADPLLKKAVESSAISRTCKRSCDDKKWNWFAWIYGHNPLLMGSWISNALGMGTASAMIENHIVGNVTKHNAAEAASPAIARPDHALSLHARSSIAGFSWCLGVSDLCRTDTGYGNILGCFGRGDRRATAGDELPSVRRTEVARLVRLSCADRPRVDHASFACRI